MDIMEMFIFMKRLIAAKIILDVRKISFLYFMAICFTFTHVFQKQKPWCLCLVEPRTTDKPYSGVPNFLFHFK